MKNPRKPTPPNKIIKDDRVEIIYVDDSTYEPIKLSRLISIAKEVLGQDQEIDLSLLELIVSKDWDGDIELELNYHINNEYPNPDYEEQMVVYNDKMPEYSKRLKEYEKFKEEQAELKKQKEIEKAKELLKNNGINVD